MIWLRGRGPATGCTAALVLLVGCRHEGPAPITTSCVGSGHAVYEGFSDPRLPTFDARMRAEIVSGRLNGREVPFGQVASVAADPTHVYTLDALSRTVFVHTLSGRFVTSFGAVGDGPGELMRPSAIGFVDPDSIFVFDVGLSRLSVFSIRGRLLRTELVASEESFGQAQDVRFGPDGVIYQLGYEKYRASLRKALGSRSQAVVRGTNTLERWNGDTGAWVDVADVPGLEVYAALGQRASLQDVPFPARALWAPGPDGLWYVDNETYSLVHYTASGERCDVQVVHANPPVTDSERAAFYDAADLGTDPRFRGHLSTARQSRAQLPVPSVKPDVDALVVSSEGNLWVQASPTGPGGARGGTIWQVFAPEGRPIGSGSLPSGFRPIVIRQDELIGVLTDSLGVDRVEALAVSWKG